MSERQDLPQPQPRAIFHVGENSTPWTVSREKLSDEELQVIAREIPMCFTDFFRRVHHDPKLEVSVEILEPSTETF